MFLFLHRNYKWISFRVICKVRDTNYLLNSAHNSGQWQKTYAICGFEYSRTIKRTYLLIITGKNSEFGNFKTSLIVYVIVLWLFQKVSSESSYNYPNIINLNVILNTLLICVIWYLSIPWTRYINFLTIFVTPKSKRRSSYEIRI